MAGTILQSGSLLTVIKFQCCHTHSWDMLPLRYSLRLEILTGLTFLLSLCVLRERVWNHSNGNNRSGQTQNAARDELLGSDTLPNLHFQTVYVSPLHQTYPSSFFCPFWETTQCSSDNQTYNCFWDIISEVGIED